MHRKHTKFLFWILNHVFNLHSPFKSRGVLHILKSHHLVLFKNTDIGLATFYCWHIFWVSRLEIRHQPFCSRVVWVGEEKLGQSDTPRGSRGWWRGVCVFVCYEGLELRGRKRNGMRVVYKRGVGVGMGVGGDSGGCCLCSHAGILNSWTRQPWLTVARVVFILYSQHVEYFHLQL